MTTRNLGGLSQTDIINSLEQLTGGQSISVNITGNTTINGYDDTIQELETRLQNIETFQQSYEEGIIINDVNGDLIDDTTCTGDLLTNKNLYAKGTGLYESIPEVNINGEITHDILSIINNNASNINDNYGSIVQHTNLIALNTANISTNTNNIVNKQDTITSSSNISMNSLNAETVTGNYVITENISAASGTLSLRTNTDIKMYGSDENGFIRFNCAHPYNHILDFVSNNSGCEVKFNVSSNSHMFQFWAQDTNPLIDFRKSTNEFNSYLDMNLNNNKIENVSYLSLQQTGTLSTSNYAHIDMLGDFSRLSFRDDTDQERVAFMRGDKYLQIIGKNDYIDVIIRFPEDTTTDNIISEIKHEFKNSIDLNYTNIERCMDLSVVNMSSPNNTINLDCALNLDFNDIRSVGSIIAESLELSQFLNMNSQNITHVGTLGAININVSNNLIVNSLDAQNMDLTGILNMNNNNITNVNSLDAQNITVTGDLSLTSLFLSNTTGAYDNTISMEINNNSHDIVFSAFGDLYRPTRIINNGLGPIEFYHSGATNDPLLSVSNSSIVLDRIMSLNNNNIENCNRIDTDYIRGSVNSEIVVSDDLNMNNNDISNVGALDAQSLSLAGDLNMTNNNINNVNTMNYTYFINEALDYSAMPPGSVFSMTITFQNNITNTNNTFFDVDGSFNSVFMNGSLKLERSNWRNSFFLNTGGVYTDGAIQSMGNFSSWTTTTTANSIKFSTTYNLSITQQFKFFISQQIKYSSSNPITNVTFDFV